jgi:fructuronate reductase
VRLSSAALGALPESVAHLGSDRDARGIGIVHFGIGDPKLVALIDRIMREKAAASLTPAPAQDLNAYVNALIARFANPAPNHRLIQIAMDGSQKIPQR